MAQGDTFVDSQEQTASSGTVETVDITMGSGNHGTIRGYQVSGEGLGAGGDAGITYVDTGPATNVVYWDRSNNTFAGAVDAVNSDSSPAIVDKETNITIDDTVGVRVGVENQSCTDGTWRHVVTGVQHK